MNRSFARAAALIALLQGTLVGCSAAERADEPIASVSSALGHALEVPLTVGEVAHAIVGYDPDRQEDGVAHFPFEAAPGDVVDVAVTSDVAGLQVDVELGASSPEARMTVGAGTTPAHATFEVQTPGLYRVVATGAHHTSHVVSVLVTIVRAPLPPPVSEIADGDYPIALSGPGCAHVRDVALHRAGAISSLLVEGASAPVHREVQGDVAGWYTLARQGTLLRVEGVESKTVTHYSGHWDTDAYGFNVWVSEPYPAIETTFVKGVTDLATRTPLPCATVPLSGTATREGTAPLVAKSSVDLFRDAAGTLARVYLAPITTVYTEPTITPPASLPANGASFGFERAPGTGVWGPQVVGEGSCAAQADGSGVCQLDLDVARPALPSYNQAATRTSVHLIGVFGGL